MNIKKPVSKEVKHFCPICKSLMAYKPIYLDYVCTDNTCDLYAPQFGGTEEAEEWFNKRDKYK